MKALTYESPQKNQNTLMKKAKKANAKLHANKAKYISKAERAALEQQPQDSVESEQQ